MRKSRIHWWPGKRLRRWSLALMVVAAVLAGAGYYLLRPARLSHIAAGAIARAVGAKVTVGSVDLGWDTITLKQVKINVKGHQTQPTSLFHADEIKLTMHPWEVLWGQPEPAVVAFVQPTLYLTENLDAHRFDYELLHFAPRSSSRGALPAVTLEGAKVQFGQIRHGQYRRLGVAHLQGAFGPSTRPSTKAASTQPANDTYKFMLQQVHPGPATNTSGSTSKLAGGRFPPASHPRKGLSNLAPTTRPKPRLTGTLNTRTMQVEMKLEHFSFARLQRAFLPYAVRQWWDRLKPRGSLPTVRVKLEPGADGAIHITSANLELDNLSLTLPWGGAFHPRMQDVSGRFTVAHNVVRIVNLHGSIAGIGYTINGQIHGLDADAPFSITARTSVFTIPKLPIYLFILPPAMQKPYKLFRPSGTFQANMTATRESHGGDIEYHGALHLINASATFAHFPYPVHDLKGVIRFDKHHVNLAGLTGVGPSGAKLRMDQGTVTPPAVGADIEMRLEAWNVPVDHYLLDAMKAKDRRAIELFMDDAARQRLTKAGLIGSAAHNSFQMGGVIRHLTVTLHRKREPATHLTPIQAITTMDLTGLSGIFKFWPYPLTATSGQVTIAPNRITVDQVKLRGLTGASGVLNGSVAIHVPGKSIVPHLTITNAKLPVDDVLLASIPSPQNHWLARMGLKGSVFGDGRVIRRASGGIDFDLRLSMAHGSAQLKAPQGQSFALSDVSGSAELQRSRITIHQMVALHGDSRIGARGQADWQSGTPVLDIQVAGLNLALNASLVNLLPKSSRVHDRLAALMKRYRIAGRFNAVLDYQSAKVGRALARQASAPGTAQPATAGRRAKARPTKATTSPAIHLRIAPLSSSFTFHDRSMTVTHMTGQLSTSTKQIALDSVGGRITGGPAFSVSGGIQPSDMAMDLRFTAKHDTLGDTDLALLPVAVSHALSEIHWQGGYHVQSGRLRFTPITSREREGASEDFHQTVTHDHGERLKTEARTSPGAPLRSRLVGNPQWKLTADIALPGDSLDVGAPITDLRGIVHVAATGTKTQALPTWALALHDGQANVWGRRIAPLSVKLAGQAGNDVIDIAALRGQVYGGMLVGTGSLEAHPGGAYGLRLTLQHAGLNGISHPRMDNRSSKNDAGGWLSASLSLSGRIGDPASRQGRGLLRVQGAKLYDQPLSLALLQAANLALPTADSFDQAAAQYLVRGNQVRFNPIRLESPSVAMSGVGTMDLPSTKLHLRMFCRNPQGPLLGALSEMANVFKDELVCVQVTGTLGDPKAKNVSLEGLRDAWNDIFNLPAPPPTQERAVAPHGEGASK